MATSLVEAFVTALAPNVASQIAVDDALAATLAHHLTTARETWPQLHVPEHEFAMHLARCLDAEHPGSVATLRAADLYLSLACAGGDVAAITLFEAALFSEVEIAGRSARATADLIAETKAHLRHVLFVGVDGRPPATRVFAGRGDLRGWVRVAALRHMLRVQKRAKRELVLDDDGLLDALSPADDPELGYIRDLYREAFAVAFRGAIAALDRRQKSLLRYQLVDGLSIDDIGRLHGVHRATAARWLAAARTVLAEETRRLLGERLGIATSEIESIVRLVQSRLDVSLERLIHDEE